MAGRIEEDTMRQYDESIGALARTYLIARTSRDVRHFDKNADHIETSFSVLLQNAPTLHREFCTHRMPAFCKRVAALAFEKPDDPADLPDEVFTQMCYIFVLHLTYAEGLTLGTAMTKKVAEFAELCKVSKREMYTLFRRLCEDMWDLQVHSASPELQIAV